MDKLIRLAFGWTSAFALCGAMVVSVSGNRRTIRASDMAQATGRPSGVEGQTATQLSDGRWLLVGGMGASGPLATLAIHDPSSRTVTALPVPLAHPRAEHTATVLPDGNVLVIGGRGADGVIVTTAEVLDVGSGTVRQLEIPAMLPRASHTATLLTDGRVLIAGGVWTRDGVAAPYAELLDLATYTVLPAGGAARPRLAHHATLLADGRVALEGGIAASGSPVDGLDVFDPWANTIERLTTVPARDDGIPAVAEARPADRSAGVPTDVRVVLRFSHALSVTTVTGQTVVLADSGGTVVPTRLIAAEDGRLAFLRPVQRLQGATTYRVSITGATDNRGVSVVPASFTFTTAQPVAADADDNKIWMPDISGDWKMHKEDSPWRQLPPPVASAGTTAVSGQVLTLDGSPLADVTLSVDTATTRTDNKGQFLLILDPSTAGHRELLIDGSSANRPQRTYGLFEYGLNVQPSTTTVLPFTIWMPLIDTDHQVTIASPTMSETVITTPYIPGLELHLPAGTVIRDYSNKVITTLSITPIPIDRPPFPLPTNSDIPVYFTIQPGSAWVDTPGPGPKGAWLVYPNYRHAAVPGQKVQFYHYDPDELGWYVYGLGTVTPDGSQAMADPTTRLYEFTGAMFFTGLATALRAVTAYFWPASEPVDPSTGAYVMRKTDLYLPDVIPLALTRTYSSGDNRMRPFGRGMTHPYAMFIWSAQQYQQADLVLPDTSMIHYVRTSAGTGYADAVFVHQETSTTSATPTPYYKSVIAWNGGGWNLTLTDGTVYVFGAEAPLQAIRDRYGNTVTIGHSNGQSGNVTTVTSPNGRSLTFAYDASNRVTSVTDNIGRTVTYTYDANGNLSTVTDPENNVTTYSYDPTTYQMTSIKDPRNITYLTNQYTNGLITRQTLADPSYTYQLAYTTDGSGTITQADITDPRGHVERLVFNANHYVVSDTQALGAPEQRTTTLTRLPGSNFVSSVTDGLNRQTQYTYDNAGHVLSVTRLAGTSNAVTTNFTYEPVFNQLATVTDPLNHTWTVTYDSRGLLTGTVDPLTHQTAVVMSTKGLVSRATDALQHAWQFGYTGADLTSVTDPLNRTTTRFVDGAGRVVTTTDPLGRVTRAVLDKLNRITAVVDPLGAQTAFAYDGNGNVLSLTDALTHATGYTYDTSDRVASRTDPLQKSASYVYDANNNLTQATDRKGQVTSYQYDALDRLTRVTYADGSTTAYTYDAGDRVTQIVDSVGGTILRSYDLLDRLTGETTLQGTITYGYDAAGRRTSMLVAGQPTMSYSYDNANRLTSISQGSTTVGFTYDDADRRSTVTLPNGIVGTYTWDAASQLTSLAYTLGGNALGGLTYTYDAAGNRTSVGGTWARTGLPQPMAGAAYDAANRITTWNGQAFSYDANGNLASDGPTSYLWNARNQLSGLIGGASASFVYDGVGRRQAKTINGTTLNFLYDGVNSVQELVGGTPTANLLVGGIDENFLRSDAAGSWTFLPDALGSTLALTDPSGAPATQYTYEPYGATTITGAGSNNPAQFTGRENDGTGLYHYSSRYYSPSAQRFTSEDDIDSHTESRLYLYVSNSPSKWVDPSGRSDNDPPGARPKGPPPIPLPPGKNGEPNYWVEKTPGRYSPKYPVDVPGGKGGQPDSSWDAEDGWWREHPGDGSPTRHYWPDGSRAPSRNPKYPPAPDPLPWPLPYPAIPPSFLPPVVLPPCILKPLGCDSSFPGARKPLPG